MRRSALFGMIVLTGCFLRLAFGSNSAAAVPAPGPGGFKWEYKVLSESDLVDANDVKTLEVGLNKLGDEGWELVAIRASPGSTPTAKKNNPTLYVFKRLKT